MLRAIVLALLVANLGFWAWRAGWLAPLHGVIGARPEGEREPERLRSQIRADAVRLLPPQAASGAERSVTSAANVPATAVLDAASEPASQASAPSPATACLEVGPYGPAEITTAETTLKAALPNGGWSRRELGPSWWVALGPFTEVDLLQKKRSELRRLGLNPDSSAHRAGSSPVLVISRHASRAAAESALTAWRERGVRSARVLDVSLVQSAVRVAQADAATQGVLAALPTEKLRGRSFIACSDGV